MFSSGITAIKSPYLRRAYSGDDGAAPAEAIIAALCAMEGMRLSYDSELRQPDPLTGRRPDISPFKRQLRFDHDGRGGEGATSVLYLQYETAWRPDAARQPDAPRQYGASRLKVTVEGKHAKTIDGICAVIEGAFPDLERRSS